jgi:hypothetical protein
VSLVSDFYLSVKSTLDKLAVDISNGLGIGFVELDDTVNVENKLASPADLVVYQMIGMDEFPSDPLYMVTFAIGAKTTTDPANYDLAEIISAVKDRVHRGAGIDVRDYSGSSAPTSVDGNLYVTETRVDPQMFDGMSGIRMLSVRAAATSYL